MIMVNIIERGPEYQGFFRILFNVEGIVMFQSLRGKQHYNTFNYREWYRSVNEDYWPWNAQAWKFQ